MTRNARWQRRTPEQGATLAELLESYLQKPPAESGKT